MPRPGRGGPGAAAPPAALLTYSAKPRGGVVHTLHLAEALHERGYPVHVVALGDAAEGFFRPVRAPFTILPAPPPLPTLPERVFASVDALAAGLAGLVAGFPVLHAQDCISARAACRIRDGSGTPPSLVVRTVHHVDDFTTQALIDCQRQAITEPDKVLVVSEQWRRILREDYAVSATVVPNGVDADRFRSADRRLAAALREEIGAAGRPLILTVGGIEPRKGSDTLVRAVALLRNRGRKPLLAVVGGHSFQDYRAYRERVFAMLPELGLEVGRDIVLPGTVADAELPSWFAAADVFAFPSTKEGWGLAVLEAMSAGLPVVASDIPVFREYLHDRRDALLVPVADPAALAAALGSVLGDPGLAGRLRAAGRAVAARFTWQASAAEHERIYAALGRAAGPAPEMRAGHASGLAGNRQASTGEPHLSDKL
jgi:glycosyltransferase-like protein